MKFYVLRNSDGKFFKPRGRSSYKSRWVDNIENARIYDTLGKANAQVTVWHTFCPEYGYPDIIVLEAKEVGVISRE